MTKTLSEQEQAKQDPPFRLHPAAVQAAGRDIPIKQANIEVFNTYATTQPGLSRYFKLTENIDLDGITWIPIGNNDAGDITSRFSGSFDGGGKTVSSLVVGSGNFKGFFGLIHNGSAKYLTLDASCTINGGSYTGGVVGYNIFGNVENCTVNCDVKGSSYTGGIAGWNQGGVVKDCTVNGNVEGTSNVGGVAGLTSGTLSGCHSTGNVIATGVTTSTISGVGCVAGVSNGVIDNCYSEGDVQGVSRVSAALWALTISHPFQE